MAASAYSMACRGPRHSMPCRMPWHAMAHAIACHSACHAMPRHMAWHAMAYSMACYGIWLKHLTRTTVLLATAAKIVLCQAPHVIYPCTHKPGEENGYQIKVCSKNPVRLERKWTKSYSLCQALQFWSTIVVPACCTWLHFVESNLSCSTVPAVYPQQ